MINLESNNISKPTQSPTIAGINPINFILTNKNKTLENKDLKNKTLENAEKNNSTKTIIGEPKEFKYIQTIKLPKKNTITYSEAGIPEEEKQLIFNIPLKKIFTTTQKSRREYKKNIDKYNVDVINYNKKIYSAKADVDKYNKAIEFWNKKGRFQETYFYKTSTPIYTITTNTIFTKNIDKYNVDVGKMSYYDPKQNNIFNFSLDNQKQNNISFISGIKTGFSQAFESSTEGSISKGFSIIKSDISKKDFSKTTTAVNLSLQDLQLGLKKIANIRAKPIVLTGSEDLLTNISKSFSNPQPKQFYFKKIKSEFKSDLNYIKDPVNLGSAIYFAGTSVVYGSIPKITQIGRNIKYKTFGTYVEPETLYSKVALSNERGLDLTFNAKKTISKFEETFNKTPELPNMYVGVHQTPTSNIGNRILTREELASKGKKQGSEPGFFISPKGYGQPVFLGVSKAEYKLPKLTILNPFKISTPTTFQVGFKNLGAYPKEILSNELNQKLLESYQMSKAPKSSAIITRMSSLGTKHEPEAIIPITSKLSPVKTKLYYTKYNNEIITIKTKKVIDDLSDFKKSNLISISDLDNLKSTKDLSYLYYTGSNKSYFAINPLSIINYYNKPSNFNYNKSNIYKSKNYNSNLDILDKSYIHIPQPNLPSGYTNTEKKIYTSNLNNLIKSYKYTPSYSPSIYYKSNLKKPVYNSTLLLNEFTNSYLYYKKQRSKKQNKMLLSDIYVPEIKIGNYWKKITGTTYNYFGAINKGIELTDKSMQRSFRVKYIGKGKPQIIQSLRSDINKYYQPSKTNNKRLFGAFIEKSKFALDKELKYKEFKL